MRHSLSFFFISAIIALIILPGCSSRLGHFTAASTQNVRNLNYSVENATKQHVEGYTCVRSVFFIPFGHKDDRLQRAMDDAIKNGHDGGVDGDLLVNVRINHSAWSAIVYGQNCISVEGDLVKLETAQNN